MTQPPPAHSSSAPASEPNHATGTEPSDETKGPAAGDAASDSPGPLVIERSGGVTWLRLNRPEAMNSLDLALKQALLAALQDAAADPSVRCVVLAGTGRAFCVGQDLKEHVRGLADPSASLATTVSEHYNPIVTLLATMNKPVIAAIGGVAAGAGLSFALACDFRIAVEGAGFNTSFAGIALSCDSGASWSLPRLIGPARAKELLLLPRTVPADEALALGLVTRVVAAAEFEQAVGELAATLAAGPTLAYGAIRRAVAHSAGAPLTESLAFEADLMALTGASSDHRIAVDAFLTKARPTYTGA